jgi:hypothetical protein
MMATMEQLERHLDLHGPPPDPRGWAPTQITELVEKAGLRGHEAASFPAARKMRAVASRHGPANLVANGLSTLCPFSRGGRLARGSDAMLARRAAAVALACTACAAVAGCGGSTNHAGTSPHAVPSTPASRGSSRAAAAPPVAAPPILAPRKPQPPPYPILLAAAQGSVSASFTPVVRWRGQTVVWIARAGSGLTVLSFDQRLVRVALHSGTIDAGGSGWRYGPSIIGGERRRLVAAFNGGFKLSVGAGGFMSGGRVAAPLRDGLGSIVMYTGGRTDIGAWNAGVPRPGHAIESVRQNLTLLIDHGRAASTLDCPLCWGATIGGLADVARSALGITADGHLIWAAGEDLSIATLADALLQAKAVRAVELDINPDWVAGYLYRHHGNGKPLGVIPVVPNQVGVAGFFLEPYSRDFFTVLTQ